MSSANAAMVLDYVMGQEPRLIDLMRELVEAESPSAQPETHDEARRVLRVALERMARHQRAQHLAVVGVDVHVMRHHRLPCLSTRSFEGRRHACWFKTGVG